MDVKLEDLMTDEGLEHYRKLFTHINLRGSQISNALSIAYKHSVFNSNFKSSHVRSRKVEDWRLYFDNDLSSKFKKLFGTVVEDLGYSW